jgi:general secretion pathway protein A
MYQKFYGLRERPFDLTPNPKYLFLTARHREALSNIQYGISGRKGITLLIGEAGTGKTTLVRTALASFEPRGVFGICVNNPALTRDEFYEFLAGRFGLSAEAASSKARFLIELEENVVQRHKAGGITALLIDEAQSLSVELLEEVRLLANLETATVKLMPLVLAGQPELAARLDEPEHRQLKQRIALRCDLMPLTIKETAAYIAGRVRIAGGDVTRMFTRDAVELIHRRSRGIPRSISVICDNALIGGLAAGTKPVGRNIVVEVCRDFKMAGADGGVDADDKAVAARPAGRPRAVARPAAAQPVAAEQGAANAAANPLADLTERLRAKLQVPPGTVDKAADGQRPAERSPAGQVQHVPPSILLQRDDD